MELFEFIFRLGIVFAIFGFIWGLIEIGIRLLTIGRQRQVAEVYILKAVKYFFLVDVTFLVCAQQSFKGFDATSQLIFGTIILLMYFVGKLQNSQRKQVMFQMVANNTPLTQKVFNMRAEIGVISFAMISFVLFWFFPIYAENPLSLWFREAITNISDTPIFGFIFKVIGFFFLINIIMKMTRAFFLIISGEAFKKQNNAGNNDNKSDNRTDFDSYEEID